MALADYLAAEARDKVSLTAAAQNWTRIPRRARTGSPRHRSGCDVPCLTSSPRATAARRITAASVRFEIPLAAPYLEVSERTRSVSHAYRNAAFYDILKAVSGGGTHHSWGLTLSVCPAMAITGATREKRAELQSCPETNCGEAANTPATSQPRVLGRRQKSRHLDRLAGARTGVSGPAPNSRLSLTLSPQECSSPAPGLTCSVFFHSDSPPRLERGRRGNQRRWRAFAAGTSSTFPFLSMSCGAARRAVHVHLL
ncbi:hypothetical protein COCON_G00200440 [Conger conger]|uniref:Uncharacterized protein n=1 Tax=Conger conger TaxID=82655 RepID=A0A9Q1D267_CONCO|nr:hypothetical protein COCON_G00200440 [Conger conger]